MGSGASLGGQLAAGWRAAAKVTVALWVTSRLLFAAWRFAHAHSGAVPWSAARPVARGAAPVGHKRGRRWTRGEGTCACYFPVPGRCPVRSERYLVQKHLAFVCHARSHRLIRLITILYSLPFTQSLLWPLPCDVLSFPALFYCGYCTMCSPCFLIYEMALTGLGLSQVHLLC